MQNSNGKRKKLQHSLTEIPRKFNYSTYMHTGLLILLFFLCSQEVSVSPVHRLSLWPIHSQIHVSHTHVQKATGFGFFLLTNPYPQEKLVQLWDSKSYQNNETTTFLWCAVFFILFSYSQIHKIQQLVVGHQVIH